MSQQELVNERSSAPQQKTLGELVLDDLGIDYEPFPPHPNARPYLEFREDDEDLGAMADYDRRQEILEGSPSVQEESFSDEASQGEEAAKQPQETQEEPTATGEAVSTPMGSHPDQPLDVNTLPPLDLTSLSAASSPDAILVDDVAPDTPPQAAGDMPQPDNRQVHSSPQQLMPQQVMVPSSPPGLVTRLLQGLFGGLSTLGSPGAAAFHGAAPVQPSAGLPFQTASEPAAPSVEDRLRWSREARAIERVLEMEAGLETCKSQFETVRRNPIFADAVHRVQAGELDPKDFFLSLARSAKSGPQDLRKLDEAMQALHTSVADLGLLARQTGDICEKAGIEAAPDLQRVEDFLSRLRDSPEGTLIPDAADGTTLADKVKDMLAAIMRFFRRDDPEEGQGPDL